MKIKKILAAIAACAMTVAAVSVTASALPDNQKAYQFGGSQVTWGWDADGDEEADTDGVDGNAWLGTLDENGKGTLKVSAEAGDLIEVYSTGWDQIPDTPVFKATIEGTTYDVTFNSPISHAVTGDGSKVNVDIEWIVTDGATDGYWNDWCMGGVLVTKGGAGDAAPAAPAADEAPAANEAAAETTTTAPATGNVPAAVMASVMAVAGVAVVASRKRK